MSAEQGTVRQSGYQYYDNNLNGKILKLNGEMPVGFEGVWRLVKKDERDPYSDKEWKQVPIATAIYKDMIIGKFTGNWGGVTKNTYDSAIGYEIELFNPVWNLLGFLTKYVNIVLPPDKRLSAYYGSLLVLDDDGTVKGQVYKDHMDRARISNYFPHHDPDYPISDCEKWDKYFGDIPWTGENAPMAYKEQLTGGASIPHYNKFSEKPWNGYKFIPKRNVNAHFWDDYNNGASLKIVNGEEVTTTFFNETGNTRIFGDIASTSVWLGYIRTPWMGGQIWNWGVSMNTTGAPTKDLDTVFDFKEYAISLDPRFNQKQSVWPCYSFPHEYFKDLTPNTNYYVRIWEEVWGNSALGEDPAQRYVKYSTQGLFATDDSITNPQYGIWTLPFAITQTSFAVRLQLAQPGDNIDEYGVCYKQGLGTPTIADTKLIITDQDRKSSNIVQITGLTPGTSYTFLPYAIRNKGTVNQEVFYTNLNGDYNIIGEQSGPINVATTSSEPKRMASVEMKVLTTDTNATSIQVGYRLVHNGNTVITDSQVGVCYSTNPNPTIADNKIYDEIPGSREEYRWRYTWAQDLNPETTYYFRAFVTNSEGTAYSGDAESVVTPKKKTGDDVITFFALQNSVTKNSKNLLFGAMGSNSVITEMGVCYSKNQNPTIANNKETVSLGNGSKYVTLTNLEANTTYYYRGYFIDADGVSYTKQLSFTTLQNILKPAVGAITIELTPTQVKIKANVTSDGGEDCVNYIAYTRIKSGLTSFVPAGATMVGSGIGEFSLTLEKSTLSSGTWYYCSYSKNSIGISQSEIKTFSVEDLVTQEAPTLSIAIGSIKDTSVYWNGQVVSTGNSEVLSAKIEIKKTSDNSLVYIKEGLLVPSDYATANGLEPETSYTIIYTVRTQYIEDNDLDDSVITKLFTTAQTPTIPSSGEKLTKISLIAQKKVGNNITFSVTVDNVITNSIVHLLAKAGSVPRLSISDTDADMQIGLNNASSQTKTITIGKPGVWYFVIALFNANSATYYSSNVVELNISIDNTEDQFGLPTAPGNGESRIIKGKRFVYNAIDNGWQRDYLYNPTDSPINSTPSLSLMYSPSAVEKLAEIENETNAYDVIRKLDRIPQIGEVVDGFEVVSVFFSDNSDSDIFPYASYYGLLLVDFDAIELCNYARAKEIADSLSAELMPIRKYPHILSYIYDRIGYSASEELWGDSETEDEASVYYANDDTIDEAFILKTQERRAIPCRILVKDRYVTNLYSPRNEIEISLASDNVNSQREVGVIERVKLTLKRKSDNAIVSSVEHAVRFDDKISISYTELVPSPVKIEYIVKCVLYRKPTNPLTHRVFVDSVSFTGGVGIISENDFELLLNTL